MRAALGFSGAEEHGFAAVRGELFKGLLTEPPRDAAASVVWTCGDLADPGKLGVGSGRQYTACARENVGIAFREHDVTVVFGFFA